MYYEEDFEVLAICVHNVCNKLRDWFYNKNKICIYNISKM